jgi:hypothetical protein
MNRKQKQRKEILFESAANADTRNFWSAEAEDYAEALRVYAMKESNQIFDRLASSGGQFFFLPQNNAGGRFWINHNIREYVMIEADSFESAKKFAEENLGIIFNNNDCECCVSRWELWSLQSVNALEKIKSIVGWPFFSHFDDEKKAVCVIHTADGERFFASYP